MFANTESAASTAPKQMSQIPVNMPGESAKVYGIDDKRADPASEPADMANC